MFFYVVCFCKFICFCFVFFVYIYLSSCAFVFLFLHVSLFVLYACFSVFVNPTNDGNRTTFLRTIDM